MALMLAGAMAASPLPAAAQLASQPESHLLSLINAERAKSGLVAAEEALRTWQGSESHWRLLASADFNYIALGMARDSNGWYYWTALLLRGPDRTPPVAAMAPSGLDADTSGLRDSTVAWSGADVPLSILTAGLKDFRLQMRVGSRNWVAATDWTTATAKSFKLETGKKYSFRIKARDKNGNKGAWSAPLTVYP